MAGAEAEILLGDLAGYRLGEDITNWKNSYTFVALDDLSLDDRRRFAPQFAAEWSAIAAGENGLQGYRERGARRPHLARLLAHARLLLVGSTDRRDLGPAKHVPLDGPYRIVEVGFARNADDYFHVTLRQNKKTLASLHGPFFEVFAKVYDEASFEGRDRLLDRVVRAATNGLADAAQIALAFWMADVGDLDGWEAHLAAIAARAAGHEAIANEVVRALREAPEEATKIELPTYGEAWRTALPGFRVRSVEGDKRPVKDAALRVPASSVWMVRGVDAEVLPAPPAQIFRLATAPVAGAGKSEGWRWVAVILLLGVLIGAAIVVARRGARVGEACREARDCRTRMCLRFEASGGEGYCTRACKQDEDCKHGLTCRALPYEGRSVCQR